MIWVDYAIIAVVVAAAGIVAWMVRSRLKLFEKDEEDIEIDGIVQKYNLSKTRNGYKFGKYLPTKVANAAIDEMTKNGWQYDDETGVFTRPAQGSRDRLVISTINAIIVNLEADEKELEEVKTKLGELEKRFAATPLGSKSVDPSPPTTNESSAPSESSAAKEPVEINVLESIDTGKTLAELSKLWNTNVNKTMVILTPYLNSKKVIKVGKTYLVNPDESA